MKSGILALGVVGFQWAFLNYEFGGVGFQWAFLNYEFGGDGGNGLGWQSLYVERKL